MSKNLNANINSKLLNKIDFELMNVLETASKIMRQNNPIESSVNYREMFSEEIKKILDKNQVQ
jgi:hypothetical protein